LTLIINYQIWIKLGFKFGEDWTQTVHLLSCCCFEKNWSSRRSIQNWIGSSGECFPFNYKYI